MRSLDPPLVTTTSVPEPAYCPRCELKHTRRPDWLCPRCGSPVDTDVPAPEKVTAPPREQPFPLGARMAGAILALTSGALAWAVARDLAAIPAGAQRWRPLVAVVALAALGVALLLKVSLARWAAIAFAAVAALVLSEGLFRDLLPGIVRDPLPGAVRQLLRDLIPDHQPWKILSLLGFDAGCLLLIVGRPRAVRIGAGVVLAVPLVLVALIAAIGR